MVSEEIQRHHDNREKLQNILDRERDSENSHNGTGNFKLHGCTRA